MRTTVNCAAIRFKDDIVITCAARKIIPAVVEPYKRRKVGIVLVVIEIATHNQVVTQTAKYRVVVVTADQNIVCIRSDNVQLGRRANAHVLTRGSFRTISAQLDVDIVEEAIKVTRCVEMLDFAHTGHGRTRTGRNCLTIFRNDCPEVNFYRLVIIRGFEQQPIAILRSIVTQCLGVNRKSTVDRNFIAISTIQQR